jgi:hypothetical protein
MPKQSRSIAILQFVIKALRWAIALVLLLFFLGPPLLNYFGAKRGNEATDLVYAGRTYIDTVVAPAGYEVFAWSVKA